MKQVVKERLTVRIHPGAIGSNPSCALFRDWLGLFGTTVISSEIYMDAAILLAHLVFQYPIDFPINRSYGVIE